MFRHARFHWGPNRVFGGWTLFEQLVLRSGLPFRVIDNSALAPLLWVSTTVACIFASPTGNVSGTCGNAVNSPCLTTSQFAPAAGNLATGPRASEPWDATTIYGPHFFDVELRANEGHVGLASVVTFSFGAQAYNVFNHPNFDQPVNDISNPQFGSSIAAVGPPTSLLGSFVGAGSSPRFLEIKGILRF